MLSQCDGWGLVGSASAPCPHPPAAHMGMHTTASSLNGEMDSVARMTESHLQRSNEKVWSSTSDDFKLICYSFRKKIIFQSTIIRAETFCMQLNERVPSMHLLWGQRARYIQSDRKRLEWGLLQLSIHQAKANLTGTMPDCQHCDPDIVLCERMRWKDRERYKMPETASSCNGKEKYSV